MSEYFHVPSLIVKKREGEELAKEEIRALIEGFTRGDVADAQMSAFAMAVYFRGMTAAETAALTYAMLESGERFVFSGEHPPVVDKHSTGGIGDKVSLILAPLVACCDCWIPMVSGRGLGITGGTLDKLESIPGFRVNLTIEQAMRQLEQIQVAMMGQTEQFCPADKKLYALRDVTGTVPSIPLITASIMSKKLAESLDRLVLDVKYGSGAFMKTREQAIVLADAMVAVGREMGVEVSTELNPMQEPLGYAVGNALEVIESIEIMQGGGPKDLLALVLSQAEKIAKVPQDQLLAKIQSGQVLEKFETIVSRQGGDPRQLFSLADVHRASVIREVRSEAAGTVTAFDAGMVGQSALELGAGRSRSSDPVDFAVGFDRLIKTDVYIERGDLIARIHAQSESAADRAEQQLRQALVLE
jgi:pyrimidine-nucleoside phosphorylase